MNTFAFVEFLSRRRALYTASRAFRFENLTMTVVGHGSFTFFFFRRFAIDYVRKKQSDGFMFSWR